MQCYNKALKIFFICRFSREIFYYELRIHWKSRASFTLVVPPVRKNHRMCTWWSS